MKIVEVRRHSIRDDSGHVTPEGIELANSMKSSLLPEYQKFVTSPAVRTKETMKAFGYQSEEEEAGLDVFDESVMKPHHAKLVDIVKSKGVTRFRAMFELPETNQILKEHANKAYQAIESIAAKIQPGESALAISHSGTIEPAAVLKAGKFHIDEINGELGVCEGIRFYFNDDNSFEKYEIVRS